MKGFRRMKEHGYKCIRAEHVNTLNKGIIIEMKITQSNHTKRNKEEDAEQLLSEARKKELPEKEEKLRVVVEEPRKVKSNISKRETDLEKKEEKR